MGVVKDEVRIVLGFMRGSRGSRQRGGQGAVGFIRGNRGSPQGGLAKIGFLSEVQDADLAQPGRGLLCSGTTCPRTWKSRVERWMRIRWALFFETRRQNCDLRLSRSDSPDLFQF